MKFWDSSAVVPLTLNQPETPAVESLLRHDSEVVLWWGTSIECASALARSAREGRLDVAAEKNARAVIEALHARAFEVGPVEDVRLRAIRLLSLHPLRTADALQLGAALFWCREQTRGVGFVCLDTRLRDAATREGFEVLP